VPLDGLALTGDHLNVRVGWALDLNANDNIFFSTVTTKRAILRKCKKIVILQKIENNIWSQAYISGLQLVKHKISNFLTI
jgi:hypothetical protein